MRSSFLCRAGALLYKDAKSREGSNDLSRLIVPVLFVYSVIQTLSSGSVSSSMGEEEAGGT